MVEPHNVLGMIGLLLNLLIELTSDLSTHCSIGMKLRMMTFEHSQKKKKSLFIFSKFSKI